MDEQFTSTTPFAIIYDRFMSKPTDDLYVELTVEDTIKDCEAMLLSAITAFEFPRFPIFDYNLNIQFEDANGVISRGRFNSALTLEEINILADLMVIEWLQRQISSVENTRMKYSGSDFKFTSQANHLDKLLKMLKEYKTLNRRSQRLYKRRKVDEKGQVSSNWSVLAGGVISGSRD